MTDKPMKHTPGPWEFDGMMYIFGKSVGGCQMKESSHMVAQIRGWGHLQYLGEETAISIQEANAHLIAAAPTMLKQLEANLEVLRRVEWSGTERANREVCPLCLNERAEKHDSFCSLIAEIQKTEAAIKAARGGA